MKEKRKRMIGKKTSIIIIDDPIFKTDVKPNMKAKMKEYFDLAVSKRINTVFFESTINPIKTNEDMRTSPPKKTSLRLELEAYVIAWNTALKEVVQSMDMVILLRNAHPAHRAAYASQAEEIGLINDFEKSEFSIVSTPRQHSRTNWRL